jgi:hypothetical protein
VRGIALLLPFSFCLVMLGSHFRPFSFNILPQWFKQALHQMLCCHCQLSFCPSSTSLRAQKRKKTKEEKKKNSCDLHSFGACAASLNHSHHLYIILWLVIDRIGLIAGRCLRAMASVLFFSSTLRRISIHSPSRIILQERQGSLLVALHFSLTGYGAMAVSLVIPISQSALLPGPCLPRRKAHFELRKRKEEKKRSLLGLRMFPALVGCRHVMTRQCFLPTECKPTNVPHQKGPQRCSPPRGHGRGRYDANWGSPAQGNAGMR